MLATRIATGGGNPRNVARSASSDDAVTQPTRLEKRPERILETVDQARVRQILRDRERVLPNLRGDRRIAELRDRLVEVREVLLERDVVDVGLEVAAVGAAQQELHRLRPGRLDVAAAQHAPRNGLRVVAEEALPDLLERSIGVLRAVGVHRVARLVGQLEVVAARLRAELALAAVEELGPARLVEPVAGVERDVDAQAVPVCGGEEALGELAPLAVAERDVVLEGAVAEVDRPLRRSHARREELGIPARVRDADYRRPRQPLAVEPQGLLGRELRDEEIDADLLAEPHLLGEALVLVPD